MLFFFHILSAMTYTTAYSAAALHAFHTGKELCWVYVASACAALIHLGVVVAYHRLRKKADIP